jgi:hypothetical protein
MTFHVGQKVVCVDASNWHNDSPLVRPVEGKVYTIAGIDPPYAFLGQVEFGLFLVGMAHPVHPIYRLRYSYYACRFRPVQEKGMSILRAIAANPKRELEVV